MDLMYMGDGRFEYVNNKVIDTLTGDEYSSRRTLCNVLNGLVKEVEYEKEIKDTLYILLSNQAKTIMELTQILRSKE